MGIISRKKIPGKTLASGGMSSVITARVVPRLRRLRASASLYFSIPGCIQRGSWEIISSDGKSCIGILAEEMKN